MRHQNVIAEVLKQTDVTRPFVRLVVVQADGSTPREIGASMLVDPNGTAGTIGGGQLEFEAIVHARRLLNQDPKTEWLRDLRFWPLGPNLGQCCGGAVRVLFERYGAREIDQLSTLEPLANTGAVTIHPCSSSEPLMVCSNRHAAHDLPFQIAGLIGDILSGVKKSAPCFVQPRDGTSYFIEPIAASPTPLFIYGAGHVGQAIVKIASDLAFDIHWVDTHAERFPKHQAEHVRCIVARQPERIAAAAPANAFHIVLTYSHAIDLSICHTLLMAPNFEFLGLIGSQTKRARFRKRLQDGGVSKAALSRLSCPIGIGTLNGKEPATIAVSVAAQLIEQLELKAKTNQEFTGEKNGAAQQIRA